MKRKRCLLSYFLISGLNFGETKKQNDLYNLTAESIIETVNFTDRHEGIEMKEA